MPLRDILAEINEEISTFTYDPKFLPDEFMWLLLALPKEDHFGKVTHLKINIPRMIIYGIRKDGILLFNDANGFVSHKCLNVDQCMTAFRFSATEVIAYEKEICIRMLPGTESRNTCYYQGLYNTDLTNTGYRRLTSDTFKHVQANTLRNFSIRERVKLRHEKYKKKPFNRAIYRLYGKTTVVSVVATDAAVEEAEAARALKRRERARGRNIDDAAETKGSPKPKKLSIANVAMDLQKRQLKGGSDKKNSPKKSDGKYDLKSIVKSKMVKLSDTTSVISYESFAAKQEVASKEQMEKIDQSISKEKERWQQAAQAALEKKKQENAWYYDEQEEEQEDAEEPLLQVKALENYESDKFNVTEMSDTAAAELINLVTNMAEHINFVSKRQLAVLVVDFVKNTENKYVVKDIVAFQFERGEFSKEVKYNVARRPVIMKFQIETFFKCDLDNLGSDVELKENSYVDEDNDEVEGVNMRSYMAAALKARALNVSDTSDIGTPNTVQCRMCHARINSNDGRYNVTSTMIYSTIMHIRSRIPAREWPSFCSDNSHTLLSMQRNINSQIGAGPCVGTTTEANLFLCSTCYRLYQEETNLIQLEHQIAVLVKNQRSLTPSKDESTVASPSKPVTTNLAESSRKSGVSSKKVSIDASGTSPMAMRRSRAAAIRPSSAPSKASRSSTSNRKKGVLSSRISHVTQSTTSECESRDSDNMSGITLESEKKESTTIKRIKSPKTRDTLYQLSRPRQLAEYYATSFIKEKKSPTKLLTDSDIREKFREKNLPSDHMKKGFIEPAQGRALCRKQDSQSKRRYPKLDDPPVGIVMSRTDLPLHITMCRLAVNFHEIVDLPVAIFDAYENFSLCYVALGRRVDAPCQKVGEYKRKKEDKFKEAQPHFADINADDSRSSTSSTSSSSSSSSSSSTSGCTDNEPASKKPGDDSDSITDEEDDEFDESCGSIENEIVVGSLQCRFFKVSYVMINGDAQSQEYHEPLTQFIQDFKCITVVLCADLKPDADITENNWMIPDIQDLSASKVSKFREKIREIRKSHSLDSMDEDDESSSVKPLPMRLPRGSMLRKPSTPGRKVDNSRYNPRGKSDYVTESGTVLPGNAIAYGHIPLQQFEGNTVKRLDVGVPLTYAIQHLPLVSTVPMLRGMVGFDRPLFPIDIWSLPYSMVRLRERNAYVPLVENQYSSTIPLPLEWVNVKMTNSDSRRAKTLLNARNSITSGSMTNAINVNSTVQHGIDIDSLKRNAPQLHQSQTRNDISRIMTEKKKTASSIRKINEVDLEREPGSIWCVCVQVLSAHHIHRDDDYFSESKRSFECVYEIFGERTRIIGDLVDGNGDESGEIKFQTDNEAKFMFSSSIGALENMFENMNPVTLKFKPLKSKEESEIPKFQPASINTSIRKEKYAKRRRAVPRRFSSINILETMGSSGLLSFNNLHKERFMEISPAVTQDFLSDELIRKNEMYPPYCQVILKLYRVGPPTFDECGKWLPPRMVTGQEIEKGVTRVHYGSRLQTNHSQTNENQP